MKNSTLVFIFISLITFSGFSEKNEQISIDNNLTITIPDGFVIHKEILPDRKLIIAESKSNNDRFFIGTQIASELDTLKIPEKKEILINNLKGFMRGIKGNNLEYNKIEIHGNLIQSSFLFEIMNPELMNGYGKIINQDSLIIIMAYFTKVPETDLSLKTKDKIFNSLKMD